jgi:CHAT domain-containing protein
VLGARWAVDDRLTAVAMFALHHYLAVDRLPAADALRAAQLWMLDPDRAPLPGMPSTLRDRARRRLLGDVSVWAAFGHHGW